MDTDKPKYFICVKEYLTQEQYTRLKKQIDDVWDDKDNRPILLEGGAKPIKL